MCSLLVNPQVIKESNAPALWICNYVLNITYS